ncbi:hypothetical protein [Pseudoalteromonas sp. A25]|uniref:hypothetical protein n=1 Tax=Pseudoalteromonas sp. A25 TaxID=116092 RepID=UPI001260E45D|nr:hypothetical protein [Pseudoalteromonas sp. A25]
MSPLSELLNELAAIINGYLTLILLWFLVVYFRQCSWRLLFARGEQIQSLKQHELYSCFMTVFWFVIFRHFGGEMEHYLLSLDFELYGKVKVFYLSHLAMSSMLILVIFINHRLRKCLFSASTRVCFYSILIVLSLLFMQLIARGYFSYHELKVIYKTGVLMSILIATAAMSLYPIRQTLAYFNKEKEA